MRINKSQIFTVTAKKSIKGSPIFKSFEKLNIDRDMDLSYVVNNSDPLPIIYNSAIEDALENDIDCLILVHDDVWLDQDPFIKLETLFDSFDLVGLAGTSQIKIESPALWHLMGGGFNGGNLRGFVAHGNDKKKSVTSFGPVPSRVLMIDGVFMALNLKTMKEMRFDEQNPSPFHFYDLHLSLDTHLKGLKVGVGDILITHESPGLREFTEDWKAGEQYFLEKYKDIN